MGLYGLDDLVELGDGFNECNELLKYWESEKNLESTGTFSSYLSHLVVSLTENFIKQNFIVFYCLIYLSSL